MNPPTTFKTHLPITILLLVELIVGLFTFRDYGLSWDEPLFYKYADALGYAYTPANWFDPNFDLSNSYGPSGDDHKTRGPAYLLLAREPVYLLEKFGVDEASAWHLVNFLTFLLGVWFVYRLSLRWMRPWAAFGAAALYSTQPLLWGHAFINPKDMPFLVFFTGALLFGFDMVDAFNREEAKVAKEEEKREAKHARRFILHPSSFILQPSFILASFFLGIATSIRVLGPLAGILVVIYAIIKHYALRNTKYGISARSFILHLSPFILLSVLVMFATWPYLWEAPLKNFVYVFRFMSDNPTGLTVLFNGELYRAFDLPRRYLPTLLSITLTEPVWPLFLLGLGFSFHQLLTINHHPPSTDHQQLNTEYRLLNTDIVPLWDYWLLLTAFLIPFAYVLLLHPPMYDGFRHFLFILPPVFVTCGLGLDIVSLWLERWANKRKRATSWLHAGLVLLLLLPGIFSAARLHPYEYAYYNSLVGGTGGAFRTYETDYWLTCYKEAIAQFDSAVPLPATLFVHREAYIAATYAASGVAVLDERGNLSAIKPGDYILVNTRSNEDRKTFHDAPAVLEVGRDGATFCVIKQVP